MRERILYFDWLRVFAIAMVVTIHVATNYIGVNYYEGKTAWLSANFYESFARSSVPLFVMISGALMLRNQKEIVYSQFLKKRVSKILVPLIAWSLIYYCFNVFIKGWIPEFSWTEFFTLFLTNGISIHFWFMYMILGLYLVTPILKIFIQHARRQDVEYFLLLWFYASVLVKITNFYFGLSFNVELFVVTNYIGYFILGYYLATYPQNVWWTRMGYIFTLVGISATFFLTHYYTAAEQGIPQLFWYEYHSPTVLLATAGIFLVFRHLFANRKIGPVLNIVNNLSFGIYLVHIMVMFGLMNTRLMRIVDDQHPLLAIPAEVIIVLTVSAAITYVISKIPIVKNLIP